MSENEQETKPPTEPAEETKPTDQGDGASGEDEKPAEDTTKLGE